MKILGFKSSLLLSVSICLILSCFITSYLSYQMIKEKVEKNVLDEISYSIHMRTEKVKNSFDDTIKTVTELATLYNKGEIKSPDEEVVKFAANVSGLLKMSIGYEDGSSYVSKSSETFPNGIGIKSKFDPRKRPWYQKGVKSDGLSISDAFFTKTYKIPLVGVMHKIPNGVLMADLKFDNLRDNLKTLKEGITGFIMDKDGLVLASNTDYIKERSNINNSDFSEINALSTELINDEESYNDIVLNGKKMFLVSKKIKLTDTEHWSFVVSVDEEVVFAPISDSTFEMAAVVIGSTVFTLLVILIVLNQLYKPITNLKNIILDLSDGEADLTKRIDVNKDDDLGKIAKGVNEFISNIQKVLIEINNSNDLLTDKIHKLNENSNRSRDILLKHTQQTDSIVTAIDEVSHTAKAVEEFSVTAVDSTVNANEKSLLVKANIENTQAKIENLADEIEKASENIKNMSKETNSIQSFVDIIGGISDKTNLLALNASIEAARAGDHGRGFAVVANEVRELATNTQESTSKIESNLSKLRDEAESVVLSIQDTEKSCTQTIEEAKSTFEILNVLNQSIEAITDVNTQTQNGASEQSVVLQSIAESMYQIHDMVEDLNKESEGINTETDEITEMNKNLTYLTSKFILK